MEQQHGPGTAIAKYSHLPALTKEQATEVMQSVYPGAPNTEMTRAILLCVNFALNPLMGHVFLIPFKGKEGTTWATVLGIKAKRLLASRRRPFSYVNDSPRLMTKEEQEKVFGKVDEKNIVAITILQDPRTHAQARGYGKWPKDATPYGTDKGNSPENMAFIRSESQALDRLCPGEMPVGIEVTDEQFTPPVAEQKEEESGAIEAEVVSSKEADEGHPHTIEQLKSVMQLCNWSPTDVGEFCNKEKGWKIKKYEDLNPEQIAEVIDHINRNPK